MKKQLIRISILQSSKIVTVLCFLMGLIYTLIGIPLIVFGSQQFRIMGIIYALMPLVTAVFGGLFFVIFAALYNFLARWLGGIEVEIKDLE
ncbi:MAG: hypothetical protein HY298_18620 [Verrucomicrobia bacterium]|nr:hypothetical protein [Verrucomicrobiota bacterium]